MNKTADKPLGARITEIILTALTIVVLFITAVLIAMFVDDYRYHNVSPYSESTYMYAAEDGEYARLTRYVKEAENYEHPTASVKQYFGLGRYFYAASMEDLADTMDERGLADYWNSRKEDAKQTVPEELAGHISRIDRTLDR